jgi:hypothetical protein
MACGDIFGRISGTAKDATGAVIPGVAVTAACVETGIKQTTKTDAQGFYAFPSLAVGHSDVQASQAGFKDFQVAGLTLDVNSALTVDLPISVHTYSENWNLTIQRQFGSGTVASVSYVGTEGHHLISNLEANPGDPALCLSVSQKSQVAPGSAVCGPNGENGVYTRADGTVINGTRGPLGPAFASDGYYITIGNSNYHAMQASLRHHSGPLEMMAGFTWSKSIDDSSGWSQMINPLNYRLSRTHHAVRQRHSDHVVGFRGPFAAGYGQRRRRFGRRQTELFGRGRPAVGNERPTYQAALLQQVHIQ